MAKSVGRSPACPRPGPAAPASLRRGTTWPTRTDIERGRTRVGQRRPGQTWRAKDGEWPATSATRVALVAGGRTEHHRRAVQQSAGANAARVGGPVWRKQTRWTRAASNEAKGFQANALARQGPPGRPTWRMGRPAWPATSATRACETGPRGARSHPFRRPNLVRRRNGSCRCVSIRSFPASSVRTGSGPMGCLDPVPALSPTFGKSKSDDSPPR